MYVLLLKKANKKNLFYFNYLHETLPFYFYCERSLDINMKLSISSMLSFFRSPHRVTTGLSFDSGMLKHACMCGDNGWHPEHGGRYVFPFFV